MRSASKARVQNAWSALAGSTRSAGNYRLSAVDGHVGLLLRGEEGPHSAILLPVADARSFAAALRRLVAEGPGSCRQPGRIEGLHERDLTVGERAKSATNQLAGRPRWATLWVIKYVRLASGTEMIQVILGTELEANAHSMLPLTLRDAAVLAERVELCATRVEAGEEYDARLAEASQLSP